MGFQLAPEGYVLGTTGSPGPVTEALLAGVGVEVIIGARVLSGVLVGDTRVYVAAGNGVGVSAVSLSPPQAASSNINAAGRRNDIVSLRLISLPPGCT